METCPLHGTQWKFIPAGVSKRTGKSYTAFYACEVRGCTAKPPKVTSFEPDPIAPVAATQAPTKPWGTRPTPKPESVSDQVWERKDRTSIAQTAINAAANVHQGMGTSSEETLAYANKLYRWIFDQRQDKDQNTPPVFDEETGESIPEVFR